MSLFRREPPPPRSVAFPVHLTLHLNPSELGPDVTVAVTFGKVDADNEVLLAEGMRNERGIPVTASQIGDSAIVGNVLIWEVKGDVVFFDIRFNRSKINAGDKLSSTYVAEIRQRLKEGMARFEFGFFAVESSHATRAERKELGIPWLAPSPLIHRQWEILCISLAPNPAVQERSKVKLPILALDCLLKGKLT